MSYSFSNLLNGFLIVFGLTLSQMSYAQSGINGYVTNESNNPLEFATIYVKEIETGTTTNIDGYFSIALNPGSYN